MPSAHHRLYKIFGLGLVFLASIGFVFLGMGDLQFGNQATEVAKVDGQAITQTQWDSAHQSDMDRALAANPKLTLALLDSPLMRYQSLQQLVQDYVLSAAARHEHLEISDARLAAALDQDPTIRALRESNGQIDMKRYQQLLAAQGMTPEGFEAGVRSDLARQQVLGGILDSEVASNAQVSIALDALRAQREVNVVRFDTVQYAGQVNPTADELQAYYKAHVADYQAPESVDIRYLVLDLQEVEKTIQINDSELEQYYEQNKASFGTPEERSVRHILIAVPPDASAAQQEAAKDKAEKLLADVEAHPDDFAAIAKKSSDDALSAPEGGELGYFTATKGIDPAIAKEAFTLKKVGDVGALVRSQFGWHIIQLSGIKPAAIPTFDALKPKLEQQFRVQEAQRKFTELADEFTNGVFEQADSLEPTAKKLGLSVQTADDVTQTPAKDAAGALANPKFIDALFSADSLDNKHNTEAIEIGANALASGHVVKHTPAHARPFDTVEQQVRTQYVNEHAMKLAQAAGEQQLKAWQEKPADAKDLPAPVTLSRQAPQGEPAALVEAAMRPNPDHLPAFVGVDLGSEGYAVVRVNKVLPLPEESAAEIAQNRAFYDQLWSAAEAQSLYDWLKTRYKAKILVPAPHITASTLAGNP